MKKFLNYLALVAVALVTTTSLIACSSDDDEESTPTPSTDNTITQWSVTAQTSISTALATVFDYSVTVTLPDGTTESISGIGTNETNTLTKVLDASKLSYPATITLSVTRSPKAGYTPTEDETYSGKQSLYLTVSGLNSKGVKVGNGASPWISRTTNGNLSKWYTQYPDGQTSKISVTITKTDTGYQCS